MPQGINSATVIGSGTMGAAIAGHLAGAGIPVTLLDIVPNELTAELFRAVLTGWSKPNPPISLVKMSPS